MKISLLARGLGVCALLGFGTTANALNITYSTGNAGLFLPPAIAGDSAMINGANYTATLVTGVGQVLPMGELDYAHGSTVSGSALLNANRSLVVNSVNGTVTQNLTMASAGIPFGIASLAAGSTFTMNLGGGDLLDITPLAHDSGFVPFGQNTKTNLTANFLLRQTGTPVPEPGSVALLVGGASVGSILLRRRRA